MASPDYACVAAIDFGTTYSGFAFSFASNPDDVHMYWDWGNCMGVPRTFKAPTTVLVGPDRQFVAFGYEAYKSFYSMKAEVAAQHSFFTHYKMHLHDTVVRWHYYCYYYYAESKRRNEALMSQIYLTYNHGKCMLYKIPEVLRLP